MAEERPRRLWVCWKQPKAIPEAGDLILTFLLPSAEHSLHLRYSGRVLFAREASLRVRKQARDAYLRAAARCAAVPVANGKTLRQLLTVTGQSSRWWYHPVSFKDCESDPTFDRIIALFTIAKIADEHSIRDLVLVGAPHDLTAVLRQRFRVRPVSARPSGMAFRCVRSLASRVAFSLKTLYQYWLARKCQETKKRDIIFSGFWNFSVDTDSKTDTLVDRYFCDLPKIIQSRGNLSVVWLAWLDSYRVPRQPLPVSILQSELELKDLLQSVFDFTPLVSLMRVWGQGKFRLAFNAGIFNLLPLFKRNLLAGFLDYSIPYSELVATATERACRRLQPSMTFSFLEHFPYARAHYEGVKRAGLKTVNYTIQHASYCSEKTFLFLDPELELKGNPDGCAVPHPHMVLTMGTFARELFLECGYDPCQVIVTGSPRYDQIKPGDLLTDSSVADVKKISLLLVGGLAIEPDLEMIEAACEVLKLIPELCVSFRKHPLSPIRQERVPMTHGGLEEDLESADIILFTYSTVAEEAFVRGRPVWQWLPQGFNASAVAEIVSIPRFGSVESLRDAIVSYRSNPGKYIPDESTRNLVLSSLFYRTDGQAALRIADMICRPSP